ncbi:MAG TPA: ABC transporter substrate-binding protein [Acidimicrobiia bacterium]|nr:ABC transporter substrate-binding protein [Acidimicrobiia bacterium]
MRRIISLVAAATMLVTTAGVATVGAQGNDRPGVTKSEIRVGGLASPVSVLNVPYKDGFDGVQAYFDLINKQGGVFGRKLKLVAQLDDQGAPSGNIRAIRTLVEEKKVFAVMPMMSNSFAGGSYLAENNVPTFGINVDAGWCGTTAEQEAVEAAVKAGDLSAQCPRSTLFGEKGSFLCFTCPSIAPAFIAQSKGLTKGAIFTYTHPSSTRCAEGTEFSFEKYGIDLVFEDKSLEFGFTDVSSDIQAMKDAGAEFVATCMDFGGAFKISEGLRQAGIDDVVFYAPEGYRDETIDKFGDRLNNWVFGLSWWPWQEKQGMPKAVKQYLAAMKKRGISPSEQSQAGWMNAMLFVEGLKQAGKDFTQASLVEAINNLTDWNYNGMRPDIDWGQDGHGAGREACAAYVEAVDGKFVPRFGKPGQPFVCFPENPLPENLDSPWYKPLKPGEEDPAAALTP